MEQTGSDGDGELNRPEPPVDPGLLQTAETVDTQIKAIRKILASARTAQIAHLPLTPPQLRILAELFKEDGLRLKVLSARLGLAHSTVSSIVDRMEERGLVRRQIDPADRRVNRVFLNDRLQAFRHDAWPRQRFGLLLPALQTATPTEQARVLDGLAILLRLLEATMRPQGDDS